METIRLQEQENKMRILIVDCLEWTKGDYRREHACDVGRWFVQALESEVRPSDNEEELRTQMW